MSDGTGIRDRAVGVTSSQPLLIGAGYQRYERHRFIVDQPDACERSHDLVRGGRAVAVLAVDLARDVTVLIRQFRIAAHLATGKGSLVEIVAGRVDAGESDDDTARRECREEIGVAPSKLVRLFSVLSSPGLIDEHVTFYLAAINSRDVTVRGGVADEHEDIETLVVPIDDVIQAISEGGISNALALNGLQWLALNRGRLQVILDAGHP